MSSFVKTLPRCHSTVRARDEELGADLGVRETVRGELRDMCLLRSEFGVRVRRALADLLSGREELAASAFGERLHSHRGEQFVCGSKLVTGIGASVVAAEPFAVQQMCPCEVRTRRRLAQMVDRVDSVRIGPRRVVPRASDTPQSAR